MDLRDLHEQHFYEHDAAIKEVKKKTDEHDIVIKEFLKLPTILENLTKEVSKLNFCYESIGDKYVTKEVLELEKEIRNNRIQNLEDNVNKMIDKIDSLIIKVVFMSLSMLGTIGYMLLQKAGIL